MSAGGSQRSTLWVGIDTIPFALSVCSTLRLPLSLGGKAERRLTPRTDGGLFL